MLAPSMPNGVLHMKTTLKEGLQTIVAVATLGLDWVLSK